VSWLLIAAKAPNSAKKRGKQYYCSLCFFIFLLLIYDLFGFI
jgi:hypothetical protein